MIPMLKLMASPQVWLLAAIALLPIATPSTAQTNPNPAPVSRAPEIGLEFEGSRSLNTVDLAETEYTGDCPGRDISTRAARFTSDAIPTGEHQRVVIKNITRGLGETPYTDREYDRGRLSEGTVVKFGTSHDSQFFTVLPGENTLQYEIRRRDVPIATGTFTALVNQVTRQVDRPAQWFNSEVCANSQVSKDRCADLRSRQQFKCSDGRVLQTRWLDERENRGVRTSFYNHTGQSVHFSVEGDRYVIQPGERFNIRRRSDFSVKFNPACHTCAPDKSQRVTYGTKMQFETRYGRIELTDDRW